MTSEREIPGSIDLPTGGWKVLVLKVPAVTLNTIWRDGQHPVMFGINGELPGPWIDSLTGFLSELDYGNLPEAVGPLPDGARPFECCGFVRGKDRRLLRGIVEDEAFIQAIPMFWCELQHGGRLPPMDGFRRWTNIFDLTRAAQPWFEYRMQGGRSGLQMKKWRPERRSTFEGFVKILSQETDSWLEVRNSHGEVLRLPDERDWALAQERINAHVLEVRT